MDTRQHRAFYMTPHVRRNLLVGAAAILSSGSLAFAQQTTVATHGTFDARHPAEELLARRITVSLTQVSLAKAIDSISRVANVFVQYKTQVLSGYTTPVTLRVTNVALGIALERVLDGTGLQVVPGSPGYLTIVPLQPAATDSVPAVGTVSGRVVDSATGRGLSGVTIKVAGTKIAAITQDSTGFFVIRNVPVGTQVVTARVFGYRPRERTADVSAGQQVTMRFVLGAVPTTLSGVVTTATGTQRKIEVGNDITTINADSLMKVAPISSVTDLLENRVPGLTVLHSSGVPGDPSRIRLRNARSLLGNNDPILIVDGVRVYAAQSDARNQSLAPARLGSVATDVSAPVKYATPSPLDQIDPSSIETIEVFKGPSASAMYGSDAANGVIVITTKRGRAGPTHWDANLGAGLSYMPSDWPVNYYRFGYGPSSGTVAGNPFCAWNDSDCTVDSVVAYQALNDPRYSPFADHGSQQSGALTVSGGSSTLLYSMTVSADGNLGISQMPGLEQQRFRALYGYAMPQWMIRPDKYTTLGGSGNVTVAPSANTSVTLSTSLYNSTQQRSSLEQAVVQLEGQYINPFILGSTALIDGEYERAISGNLTFTNALTARWRPVSWLPLTATAGLSTDQRVDNTYVPFGIYLGSHFGVGGALVQDSSGSYGLGRGTTLDKTLTVGTSIPMRRLTLGVGGNYHAGSTSDFSAYTNLLGPGIKVPSAFVIDSSAQGYITSYIPTQNSSEAATYGWYVEPRFNVASRFFVSPGFRLDGGSASGAHVSTNAGGINIPGLTGFPKLDLSYILVDRQDDPLWGAITMFRPRLALGVAGTQPSPQQKLRNYNTGQGTQNQVTLNGTLVPVIYLSSVGNTQLEPERSREVEGGFDIDLWNNRFALSVTQFDRARHNAIEQIPIAASVFSGFYGGDAAYYVNVGDVRGTGTELTMNAQVLESGALGWHVTLNLSHEKEVLTKLNPGQSSSIVSHNATGGGGVDSRLVEGYPLWGEWARPIASYADANGDGVLEANEIRLGDSSVYLGQQTPKYTMGVSTHLDLFHGALGLNASFAYQNGFTQTNAAALNSGALLQLGNTPGLPLATQAAIIAATNGRSKIGLVQTVSELRFQDLSISYLVPPAVSRHFRVPHLRLALQGSNLGLHTNYRGMDPNVNAFSTSSQGDISADTGQLPLPRTWSLHVMLGN